jgi:transcriptional antiterminator RfaH
MKQWYVAHTQAHGETRALFNLKRQGFEAWLPRVWRKRRHARRAETVLRPLFSRYLFIHIDLEVEPWRPILSTFGISYVVGGDSGPHPIPDAVIDALMARTGPDGYFELGAESFRSGDKVRILEGPLAELEGIFQAASDDERVMILLRLMGREVRVTVSGNDIEAV